MAEGIRGFILAAGPGPSIPVSPRGFKVGDVVRFNAHGLSQIGGLRTPEQVAAHTKGVKILAIEDAFTVPPSAMLWLEEPFYSFLTTDWDVELA